MLAVLFSRIGQVYPKAGRERGKLFYIAQYETNRGGCSRKVFRLNYLLFSK